jgi:hypothetical protein
MKKLVILMALAFALNASADLSTNQLNKIVDSIYVIEGGVRAKVPYGILSVKVRDKAHARLICYNTVSNNFVRWEKAGRPGKFLDFLANKYCPPSADAQGNKNWKRNIRKVSGFDF